MKTVIFLRHGKSDWNADYGPDHDRPLAGRGRKASRKMGRYLTSLGEAPELVITSTAVRARSTARLAAKAGEWPSEIQELSDLYDSSASEILDLLRRLPARVSSVMLVGHEPTWSTSIAFFSGTRRVRFPTAAMARIDFRVEAWQAVEPGGGTLVWTATPKSLPDDV